MQMKLSHKLFLLVAIPLCFELLLLGILATMDASSRAKAYQEKHSKEIIFEINHLHGSIYETTVALMIALHAEDRADSYRTHSINLEKIIGTLERLTSNDEVCRPVVKRLRIIVGRLLKLFNESAGISGIADFPEVRRELLTILSSLRSTSVEIVEHEGQLSDLAHPEAQKAREALTQALYIGIGMSIVVTLMVAIITQRHIAKRLGTIMNNIGLFESRTALSPRLNGTDEIVILDQFFHEMAGRVRESEAKQQELQRLKAEFMSMISHDLKAPIASTQLFLDLLAVNTVYNVPEKVAQRASSLEADMSRLLNMIKDLLELEKIDQIPMELTLAPHSSATLISRSIASVSGLAENADIEIHAPTTDVVMRVDGDQIVRVIVNLLSNAIKFSPVCGEVNVLLELADDFVEISVRDQGRGIAEEFSSKLFERYQQAEITDGTLKGGTGLGLAICKAIVERHGGEIGVESAAGKGCRFWFTIPRSAP